ncbi:hypothetical protein E2C01_101239 [Portunus trituberculatus]|uniref:Uncharacterized protein n=1 Tax=Portunus trituberculatus TaxID=210409 RepID=A0A5B7K578_PORTR|nr:hypothetical protein [Portunus trituberculatus]
MNLGIEFNHRRPSPALPLLLLLLLLRVLTRWRNLRGIPN